MMAGGQLVGRRVDALSHDRGAARLQQERGGPSDAARRAGAAGRAGGSSRQAPPEGICYRRA